MIFIRRHLDKGLKGEYLTVEDPLTFWKALRNRYNHQKTMILPMARYEWTYLRIQDFMTMAEHNYAMFIISSQMKLCGETIIEEDMLENTFSTFHAQGFTEYNQQIYVLLVAEQNNKLLIKNHQSQPTRSVPFLEVNVASLEVNTPSSRGNNYKRGYGNKRGRWNGKGKNYGVQFQNQVLRHNSGPSFKNANRQKGKAHMNNTHRNPEGVYHRCGVNGH
ncbi:uncharacterized protein [Malus domestica]|uniref:uncharacterized protein n=1 Tax=Malus domestica TaxID=3750 RepID=UPI0004987215|nr:uncharacterized protein LOC103406052 [Malus domestica]